MSEISKAFNKLKKQGNGALIGYIMCGDPEPKYTQLIAEALIKGGIDILELGLPFSDPIADGPTIQAASTRALQAGMKPKMIFEIVKYITKTHNVPVAVMTYYNPMYKMGLEQFFNMAKESGVSGVITPDLPIDEADEYIETAKGSKIDTIFLAAPSTSKHRLRRLVTSSKGFLYLVSRFGVTGAQSSVADSTISLIKRVLPFTEKQIPLAVGFGVSKPDHVKRILGAGAEGVIVGSAFVNIVKANQNDADKMLLELEETAAKLKQATLQ